MRISFYAPLKSPDHPVPSGDRRVARLIMEALKLAGHKIALASNFRSYEGTGDAFLQESMSLAGREEAERIIDTFLSQPAQKRPDVWFTYHLYYKAPDYIGPAVSAALGIPYVVAEPSHAPKRANGPWKKAHEQVTASLEKTDCAFCLTQHDMACVEPVLASPERLVYLPPFLDVAPFQHERSIFDANRKQLQKTYGLTADVILVAVGMMRSGDKFASYQLLAESLAGMRTNVSWQLLVVGDGKRATEIQHLFRNRNELGDKVIFGGELTSNEVTSVLGASDICVWPAAGEAYGMALLEGQAAGLPVVAGDLRGVPDVVKKNVSAFLTPPGDTGAFAAHTKMLIEDAALRQKMGEAAIGFVAGERSLQHAADILDKGLKAAITRQEQKS